MSRQAAPAPRATPPLPPLRAVIGCGLDGQAGALQVGVRGQARRLADKHRRAELHSEWPPAQAGVGRQRVAEIALLEAAATHSANEGGCGQTQEYRAPTQHPVQQVAHGWRISLLDTKLCVAPRAHDDCVLRGVDCARLHRFGKQSLPRQNRRSSTVPEGHPRLAAGVRGDEQDAERRRRVLRHRRKSAEFSNRNGRL